LHKNSVESIARSVHIAFENLFDKEKNIGDQCKLLFLKYLTNTSEEVVHQYDVGFLHLIEKPVDFLTAFPYLKKFIKSKVGKSNPHYFLEYVLKNGGSYPKECIELINGYKSFKVPNHSNGPFYADEPIKIVLNSYNAFNNNADKKNIKKTIKLFDEMLQTDYLRKEAYQALNLVER